MIVFFNLVIAIFIFQNIIKMHLENGSISLLNMVKRKGYLLYAIC